MKTKTLNLKFWILLCALCASVANVFGDLTVTIQPGYTFGSGEAPTTAKLNRLGNPTATISGTLGGTNAGLAAGSINGTHLADAFAGSNLTWDATSPRRLVVANDGIYPNQVNATVAGSGLGGGAGVPLFVKPDGNTIRTNTGVLEINTNAAAASSLTLTDRFCVFPGNLGTMKMSTLTLLLNLVSNNIAPQKFVSGQSNIVGGSTVNVMHGLSNAPQSFRAVLICVTPDAGYTNNDEVEVSGFFTSGGTVCFSAGASPTNVFVNFRTPSSGTPQCVTKGSDGLSSITLSRWRAKVYATYFP